jgi:acetylornithine deacetylase/succinyl-diaminopimelate desuccinylase-like protein
VTPRAGTAKESRGAAPGIDFEAALWDCIGHLQALIRMDTVNPPGQEIGLARYLDDVLRGAGIATHLFEPAPGRAALTARIAGNGRARPILLLAHMDVVGVERSKWRTNPFGAEILDGYLYGRGAIDDKGMLAVNLQTMLILQEHVVRAGSSLDRDVVFVATSDEETGGEFGIDWLLTHHRALLDAEFALNEGGRVRQHRGQPVFAAVQCGEKVPNVLRLTATGPSGHAAIPLPDNAVVRLARGVAALGAYREPLAVSPLVRRYFAGLADTWTDPEIAAAMADVASGEAGRERRGADRLASQPRFDAVLRNGISPTMLHGGVRPNVIPGEASATLNVRLLPGESLDDLVRRVEAVVDDPQIRLTVESRGVEAPASPPEGPMYRAIEEAVAAQAPGIPTVPFLSTGATDSAPLRRAGVAAYGLLPFPLTEEDENRMHGHDERVPVTSLEFAIRLTWDIVHRVAAPA